MHVLLMAAVLAAGAADDSRTRGLADFEAEILSELAAVAPAAVPDARMAAEAYDAGKWQESLDAYGRVLAAAPGFSHALRRSCMARVSLGDRAGGLPLCRKALEAAPTPENQLALATALAERDGKAEPLKSDLAEAKIHARIAFDFQPAVATTEGACMVGLRLGDESMVRDCADRLKRIEPGAMLAEYFAIFGSLMGERWAEARAHLAAARAAGLPEPEATRLERVVEENEPLFSRYGWQALWATLAWLGALLVLLGTGSLLSAATLRRARAMATDQRGEAASGASLLRRTYAGVLLLTCAAYYLSIPMVLLVLLSGAAGVWFLFAAIGRIPVKLLFIAGSVVVVSIVAVVKSIWVSLARSRSVDPGLPLDVGAHPGLGGALREAAQRVGTRPVDKVFLTPGVEVAVFERGGLTRQITGGSERCLILGVGVLDGMTQGQMKAVLAHEYGHFVNRDTAGGGMALAVRRAILQMATSLAQGGAAAWYNPAWLFVTQFHSLFLRVSQGASRLQEILADRWAALAYGGAAFASGLRHVVERGVRFRNHAGLTIKEVIDGGRPLGNLYAYVPAVSIEESEIAAAVEKAMASEPSPFDSHPRPVDRIAWVGEVASTFGEGIIDRAPAWDLFSDREALERRLTDEVRKNVRQNHGVAISA